MNKVNVENGALLGAIEDRIRPQLASRNCRVTLVHNSADQHDDAQVQSPVLSFAFERSVPCFLHLVPHLEETQAEPYLSVLESIVDELSELPRKFWRTLGLSAVDVRVDGILMLRGVWCIDRARQSMAEGTTVLRVDLFPSENYSEEDAEGEYDDTSTEEDDDNDECHWADGIVDDVVAWWDDATQSIAEQWRRCREASLPIETLAPILIGAYTGFLSVCMWVLYVQATTAHGQQQQEAPRIEIFTQPDGTVLWIEQRDFDDTAW